MGYGAGYEYCAVKMRCQGRVRGLWGTGGFVAQHRRGACGRMGVHMGVRVEDGESVRR